MISKNFTQLIMDIRQGECRSRDLSNRLLVSEDGLITWATLVAVLLLIALIGIVFNVGRVSNDKLQSQNAADSVAYSSSLVHARAMNAVTATNHMMGELTALHTMHHAIGGEVLDRGGSKNNWLVTALNVGIRLSYGASGFFYGISLFPGGFPNPPQWYGPATDSVKGEATIYDSKCMLKSKFPAQYAEHVKGSLEIIAGNKLVLTGIPWLVVKGLKKIARGHGIRSRANKAIRALIREYDFINNLQTFAIRTRGTKLQIPRLTDGLWAYERLVVTGTPLTVNQVASKTAKANGCVGETLGRPGLPWAALPLIQDPCRNSERTQLMRATYPWVQEWRWPLLAAFGLVAPQSRAMIFYEYHSDRYSRETCKKFVNQNGYRLYVIEELDATSGARDKGRETWRRRDFSRKADQMFALVGIARKENPPAMALNRFFIPVANETPIATVAQAMIYNVNEPKQWRRRGWDFISWRLGRKTQPVQAWDTLAWTEGATEWKDGKPYFTYIRLPKDLKWMLGNLIFFDFINPPDVPLLPNTGPPTPKLRLNWQAKLSPVSASNLSKRILMTRDANLRKRMIDQVLPIILAEQARVDLITH